MVQPRDFTVIIRSRYRLEKSNIIFDLDKLDVITRASVSTGALIFLAHLVKDSSFLQAYKSARHHRFITGYYLIRDELIARKFCTNSFQFMVLTQ